jgi:GST-like protein
MSTCSSAIYALHWIKPDVRPQSARRRCARRGRRCGARAHRACWRNMDSQLAPAPYLLGERLTVLDLYVGTVSRFGPWRERSTRSRRA